MAVVRRSRKPQTLNTMKFEIEVSTEIAMIGIWDTAVPSGDIPFKGMMEALSKDGRDGKLLRVDSGADGDYTLCVVSTLEELQAFPLEDYARIEHDFFLRSESGAFIAGGIEDYRNGAPQVTLHGGRFQLEPGSFRIHVYAHTQSEEQLSRLVEAEVGEDDLRSYENRRTGGALAAGSVVVGILLGYFWSPWALLPAAVLAAGVLVYFSRVNAADPRIRKVEQAFRAHERANPDLLFRFEPVSELGISRGAFHLDEVPG